MRELITVGETHRILDELRLRYYLNRDIEEVRVEEAVQRELAADVRAAFDIPRYDIATMDGFAIKFGKGSYRIVGEIYAGNEGDYSLNEGECYYITTGAKMPANADTVVKVEIAEVRDGVMRIREKVDKGKYVLKRGSELKAGDLILKRGVRLEPQEIAVLKSAGVDIVKVYRRVRAAVFSNGDEIKNGIIKDSNSAMIMAFLKKWGCEVSFLGTAGDEPDEVKELILQGVKGYDVVITSGGVSVGKRDCVVRALSEIGELIVYRVRQRPGKPMAIAIVNNKPVFALPGKPAGAFTAMLSLRRYFNGDKPFPKVKAKLTSDVLLPTPGFDYFLFVKLKDGYAIPAGYRHSNVSIIPDKKYEVSLVSAMSRSVLSDGFISTQRDLKRGEEVEVNLYD